MVGTPQFASTLFQKFYYRFAYSPNFGLFEKNLQINSTNIFWGSYYLRLSSPRGEEEIPQTDASKLKKEENGD